MSTFDEHVAEVFAMLGPDHARVFDPQAVNGGSVPEDDGPATPEA